MSTFIVETDYYTGTKERILDLILDESATALDNAETDAKSYITDMLGDRYDLVAEFAKAGAARNPSLIRWMVAIALYRVYARIPDEQVPERVLKDYDDTRSDLEKISKGSMGCSLKRLTDSGGENITRIRMGNNTPRSHDPYALV